MILGDSDCEKLGNVLYKYKSDYELKRISDKIKTKFVFTDVLE